MGDWGIGITGVAFWAFVAVMVVAETWAKAKKDSADRELLQKLIESGKPIDQSLLDQVLGNKEEHSDRGLRTAGIIVLSLAPGFVIFGIILGYNDRDLHPMIGIGGLMACLGAGLLIAASIARKSREKDTKSTEILQKEL